ncbi:MAG: tetratricopeptide repeat-containing sensor histidine kinase, partial [Bacteroidota bacterium]
MAKIFLGLIIGLASLQPVWSQEHRADLEWYQNFFQERKRQPVEEELAFYNAKLEQARSANDAAAEAHARMEIGLVHLTRTHDYERALDFFIRSLAIEDSLELKHESMFTYMAMAQVFEVVGDYYKSADFLKQAMRINEQSKDVNVLVVIANRLGRIHAARGQIDEALENYELVLIYKDQLNNSLAEAEALFNLGHLYTQQGKYDEALQSHKQALAIRREAEDKKNEALSLNDIGELYRLMKNEDKALANHQVALEIRLTLKDKKGLAESYNNIAALYFQQQKFELAIAQLQHALDAAQDLQLQDQIRKSYDYFSECYEALGDYKKALHYKDLFLAINDFIQNEKNELRLLETQNRYVINKKESQIEKLESIRAAREKEIEAQRKFGNILVAFIALSLVVVAMIFYLYVVNKRSNKRLQVVNAKVQQQNLTLQELNATKDKFFSIISHDLKGPLNSLTSFSGLLINHIDTLSKEEIQMLAKDLDKSLKNLFALLENLLEWSRSQTGNLEFKPESFDLAMLLD